MKNFTLGRRYLQTLDGSFSTVSTLNLVIKTSVECSRRDLHSTHLSYRYQISNVRKKRFRLANPMSQPNNGLFFIGQNVISFVIFLLLALFARIIFDFNFLNCARDSISNWIELRGAMKGCSDTWSHGHPAKLFTRPPRAWFSSQAVFRRASAAHFCVIPYSRPPSFSQLKTATSGLKM